MVSTDLKPPCDDTKGTLHSLPNDHKFYRGMDAHRGLVFDRSLYSSKLAKLSDVGLIAMGLSELCRKTRIGHVFDFETIPHPRGGVVPTFSKYGLTYTAFKKVPTSLYVPHIWSDQDCQKWDTLTLRDRLAYINGHISWLRDDSSVMPVNLQCHAIARPNIRLSVYSFARVSLMFVPQAFLGDTSAMCEHLRLIRVKPQEEKDYQTK